jgi:chemotaxis protein MotB
MTTMRNRRKSDRGRVSHERWLVSYADFITLLFAFFVVLYAFSKADQKKQSEMAAAVNTAFKTLSVMPGEQHTTSRTSQAPEAMNAFLNAEMVSPAKARDDLEQMRHQLIQSLSKEISQQSISVEMTREGLVISLREAGFFNSGSATPRPESLPILRQIADRLNRSPYDMRVEGHTDNVPIHTAEFESNWELSSARATHIARIFLELKAITPERLSAAGFAEFHPVASNDTAEGRAKNRRVDLVILPRTTVDFTNPSEARPGGGWHKITDDDATVAKP